MNSVYPSGLNLYNAALYSVLWSLKFAITYCLIPKGKVEELLLFLAKKTPHTLMCRSTCSSYNF